MKVALITTVYNAMPHIERCIASIRPQLNEDIGWIIVDAGSTDQTWARVRSLAMGNPFVDAVQCVSGAHPIPRGRARHIGALLSPAEILIHAVDGDTVYFDDAVKRIIADFEGAGRIPTAGDSFFAITRAGYFAAGGYNQEANVEEDLRFYEALKTREPGFRVQNLGIECEHLNPRALREAAKRPDYLKLREEQGIRLFGPPNKRKGGKRK